MWDLVQPGPLPHLGGAERIAGLVYWRGPLTGCSAWAAHTPSPVQATQELVSIHGAPLGSEDTHFTPSTSGPHVPTRTHTHISSETAAADLKIPAGDSEGERRTVVEALWAGRVAYLEAGAEGGGRCCYLPPHILNPAASPRLPYTAPGTPSQAMEGREVTSEGDHPPQTKGWGALGPTLESGRVCLVLVLAASLIKLASGRMGIQLHHVCDQREDGTIPGSGDP
ncbi:uncharacterized protein LOC133086843 [Eubalaena glacialis]|uniref:uncharacterized protein LOC133086843 n=1 Tax=Eubalaena glacialis TaxID=27606 RepID=UPI002A5AE40F|nr:uncharacterized protein LOC133086843 [Eubalaena glacialis]XP_061039506.1 uncharacterized protein LOC133086843 [Eubalaena glacialis]